MEVSVFERSESIIFLKALCPNFEEDVVGAWVDVDLLAGKVGDLALALGQVWAVYATSSYLCFRVS